MSHGRKGTCNARCKKCLYGCGQGMIMCDYIGYNNRPRPCPAGAECTEFVDRAKEAQRRRRHGAELTVRWRYDYYDAQ